MPGGGGEWVRRRDSAFGAGHGSSRAPLQRRKRLSPRGRALFAGKARKAQILAQKLLGNVQNLAGVERKVFNHVAGRLHAAHLKTLDGVNARQRRCIQPLQHPHGVTHGAPQPVQQQPAGQRTLLAELQVALAAVGGAAQPGNNPLAHVTGQVQRQVAGAVGSVVRPPPDLPAAQPLQAGNNAGQVVALQSVNVQGQINVRQREFTGVVAAAAARAGRGFGFRLAAAASCCSCFRHGASLQ
jgi:hypothetical protein